MCMLCYLLSEVSVQEKAVLFLHIMKNMREEIPSPVYGTALTFSRNM